MASEEKSLRDEEQNMELEALRAIYMIRLEVVEGSVFNEVILSWTIDLLEKVHKLLHLSHSEKAKQNAGQPQAYLLVERLKEMLELYNEDVTDGLFTLLSPEILLQILGYLPAADIARFGLVNKNLKRISEDNSLWEDICYYEKKFRQYSKKNPPPPDVMWKKYYTDMLELVQKPHTVIAAVVARKGTGDEWPTHFGDWHEYFASDMKSRGINMDKSKRIMRIEDKEVMGHFCYIEKSTAKLLYGNHPWYIAQSKYSTPYTGYVSWIPKSGHGTKIMKLMIAVARGTIASLQEPDKFCFALKDEMYPITALVNKIIRENWSDVPLLIKPDGIKQKVKYLHDLVDGINGRLLLVFKDKDKSKETNRNVFVQYSDHKRYYPFTLEMDWIPKESHPKLFKQHVKVWVKNLQEIGKILPVTDFL